MSAKFASVTALRDSIVSGIPQEYKDRMYQPIQEMEVVKDRSAYLIEKAKDKSILDIGCTGSISKKLREVAREYHGIDIVPGEHAVVDLDNKPHELPAYEGIELIICSEFLEHLANPGWFLAVLKRLYPERTVIFTVPHAGSYTVKDNCEVVNAQHVCWYSPYTLKNLLTRYKYQVAASAWYHGEPFKAEGIIMVAQT
jgi:2-polyprenyl-3-methyl-5-hydroxy-6-metoxy-1,4-benzoquinol methylase